MRSVASLSAALLHACVELRVGPDAERPRIVREEFKASPGAKALLERCDRDVDRESNRVFRRYAPNVK